MIPNICHICWFPPYEPSELAFKCWFSWGRFMPDFLFHLWRKDRILPMNPWVEESMQNNCANLFSYMRFWALYTYGGVFMDNDVELIRPLDLMHEAFCGFQRVDQLQDSVNVAVLACEPQHPLAEELLKRATAMSPLTQPLAFGPTLITQVLMDWGLSGLNREQTVRGVKVYSREKFYPWWWEESADMSRVTPDTIGIHWWEGSWLKTGKA